jgi:hypothetical protein
MSVTSPLNIRQRPTCRAEAIDAKGPRCPMALEPEPASRAGNEGRRSSGRYVLWSLPDLAQRDMLIIIACLLRTQRMYNT